VAHEKFIFLKVANVIAILFILFFIAVHFHCYFFFTTCFQFTTLTTKALMFLITCDCFNIMYSTQILGHMSFNPTIPKSFLTIMQLNLITITSPFLADLIDFYEKKVSKELNQVAHRKLIFF